jgi:hypothetical protein
VLGTEWPVAFETRDPKTMKVAVRRGMPALKAMSEFLQAQAIRLNHAIDAEVRLHYGIAVDWYIEAGSFLLAGDVESCMSRSKMALRQFNMAVDRQDAVNSGRAK